MDISQAVTTDATGKLIFEFNVANIASMLITFDSAAYWGLNDLSMAVTPVLQNGIVTIDWQAFPPETIKEGRKIVRIFAKRQAAGTLTCYVNFIGRHRS